MSKPKFLHHGGSKNQVAEAGEGEGRNAVSSADEHKSAISIQARLRGKRARKELASKQQEAQAAVGATAEETPSEAPTDGDGTPRRKSRLTPRLKMPKALRSSEREPKALGSDLQIAK